MRTVSQLSKLTGINRRTVQYYATEKVPGKSGEGAGIITPCHVSENGYRYFDDDALFKLLAIKTLKQCGYEPEAIRRLFESEELDIAESADMQIKALERAKRELDQQMQFVNLIKLLGTADRDSNEEITVVFMSLMMKMLLISIEQIMREYDSDFILDLEDESLKSVISQQRDGQAVIVAEKIIKVMGHAEKGEMDLAVEALPAEIKFGVQVEGGFKKEAVFAAITLLQELFKDGVSPQSKKAQHCAALVFQETFPKRRLIELEAWNEIVSKLMEGTYMAILVELLCGEGFVDYVTKAFGSYYQTAKKRVVKKGDTSKVAEASSQAGLTQAATA